MTILMASSYYHSSADDERRQRASMESLRRLEDVKLVNLQFADEPNPLLADGFENLFVLRDDSLRRTGATGKRKPVTRETFDVLAEQARIQGCSYFAFLNADIVVTADALRAVRARQRAGFAFSRCDIDPDGRNRAMMLAGVDMFVISAGWWLQNQRRFRPYLIGENIWDNVYTSILLCHGDGMLLNRDPLIFHERHAQHALVNNPFAPYGHYLASLDSIYFSIWVLYYQELCSLREKNALESEELALQQAVFRFRPSQLDRVVHAGRVIRAHMRYRQLRGRISV